jgi:hypothetical protein
VILVEMTINGTLHRISDEYLELTHLWEGMIVGIEPITKATRALTGGYVEPQYGGITLHPDLFAGADWPPPKSCAITVKISDTTEEDAVTIFSGVAHRTGIAEDGPRYAIYGPSYSNEMASDTLVDGTLLEVFTTYCGASYLNLTLSHTYDRATSPQVYRKVPAGSSIIDMLSEFAEATNHLFYISGSTIYLVDMLIDNGSEKAVTEDDFSPPEYTDQPPYRRFSAEGIGVIWGGVKQQYSVAGTYAYGTEDRSDVSAKLEHFYMRCGDNSGNDLYIMRNDTMIQYDPDKYYRVSAKIRTPTSSDGGCWTYAGIVPLQADRATELIGEGGVFNNESLAVSSAWTEQSKYWHGTDDAAPYGAGTIGDPIGMPTGTEFLRPLMTLNIPISPDTSAQCITDVDYFEIVEVDSSGNVLEVLFRDDFLQPDLYKWYKADPGAMMAITANKQRNTSINETNTALATALANRKSILEAAGARVTLPLRASYLCNPGQKLSWTDTSVCPDGESITAWIRARDITIDFDQDSFIYTGEGSIS